MKLDLRGQHLSPRTCEICGKTYQPKMTIQATCGEKCAQKKKNARRTASGIRKVGYDNRQRFYGSGGVYKIVTAPDEFIDYIGLEYNSLEYHAALEMGCFPPGVVIEHGAKRLMICGDPTPIDFALTGKSYRHQKAVEV